MLHDDPRPQLGVSACLLGRAVRFDGGHRLNRFIKDTCAEYFDFHPMCPEAELGLGIPRPAIQLRKFSGDIRLVHSRNHSVDITDSMTEFSRNRVESLGHLDGFIFKKDSPTCGLERVSVHDHHSGMRERSGMGLFTKCFTERFPDVPLEEEGRLNDEMIRENFFERVYAHARWRRLNHDVCDIRGFEAFHRRYKLILMARNSQQAKLLGRIVAGTDRENYRRETARYFSLFMRVMSVIPSRGQHVNVMMHMMGYLKKNLSSGDKRELLGWLERYRNDRVSRITPLALLQHHFMNHTSEYIDEQYYLSPFPHELMQLS